MMPAAKIKRLFGKHHPDSLMLILFLAAALGMLIFLMIGSEVREGEVFAIDRWLIMALRSSTDPAVPVGPFWLRQAVADITVLGGSPVLTLLSLLAAGYLLAARKPATALLLVGAISTGELVGTLLKHVFVRARPDLVAHLVATHSTSFPSGHAMNSAVAYLTAGALLARSQADRPVRIYLMSAAMLLTLIIGFSRVYLGVHWPSDVLAGWCVGATWAIFCSWVARVLKRRRVIDVAEDDEAPRRA